MFRIGRVPEGEPVFGRYSVKVNGEKAVLHCARVSAMPYNTVWPGQQRPIEQTEVASFLSVEADEALNIEVEYEFEPQEVTIRPLSEGVIASVDGKRASFTVVRQGQYTVEADGHHEAFHLFVNPPKDFGVRAEDENVIWFGPGIHRPGLVLLKSGQTVYIDRDAVVYGAFAAVCQENVRVCGCGVIDGSWEKRVTGDTFYLQDKDRTLPGLNEEKLMEQLKKQRILWGGVKFWNCKNVRLEGCVIRDTATFAVIPGGCDGVLIDGVKTIGMWRYNSDGIDLINSRNALIRNCFVRDFDDCIVIKGVMGYDTLNNENITVENCVVWCDWGRALEIGAETNAPEYRNIVFHDCDIIHGSSVNLDIQHHNHALVHDILFSDIRIEYTRYQMGEVYQHDMTAPYPNPQPPRLPTPMGIYIPSYGMFNTADYRNGNVRDVAFRNISMIVDEGVPQPVPEVKGLDAEHTVEHVVFSGITLNGKKLETKEEALVRENEWTGDIVLR